MAGWRETASPETLSCCPQSQGAAGPPASNASSSCAHPYHTLARPPSPRLSRASPATRASPSGGHLLRREPPVLWAGCCPDPLHPWNRHRQHASRYASVSFSGAPHRAADNTESPPLRHERCDEDLEGRTHGRAQCCAPPPVSPNRSLEKAPNSTKLASEPRHVPSVSAHRLFIHSGTSGQAPVPWFHRDRTWRGQEKVVGNWTGPLASGCFSISAIPT